MHVYSIPKIRTMALAIAGGFAGLVFAPMASAADRPDPCDVDHDHRSHHVDYYQYYDEDKYFRAGPYRSGASFSISVRDRRDRFDDGYRDRGYERRARNRRGQLLRRDVFRTRYRARVVLTEERIFRRGGARLICTVTPRGPEADYIPYRRLKRIANRNCSRSSRIRILA